MLTLTDSAVKAVSRFVAGAASPVEGLRISVTGGGCSGFQYGIKLEAAAAPEDTVIDSGGVKVIVDPASLPMVEAWWWISSTAWKLRLQVHQP
ncbi:HesB/IscA family protein [Methylogaea oryzae]|uniref:HesB/IscA family protein n=1 Tax=Methylogaea oryzae TaxID=1295382 RepID=UPI000A638420|nr:iron-sulfur cluster assembly accessory protein [Methylogaea oryzae]